MKPHLPASTFRSLLTCFAAVAATTLGSLTASAATYPKGSKTYTSTIYSDLTLKGYSSILFRDIKPSSDSGGSAITIMASAVTLSGNGDITFNRNSAVCYGGAIDNDNILTLTDNGNVIFSANSSDIEGGAIYSDAIATLSGNADVTFSANTAGNRGGAIYSRVVYNSDATVTLSGNGGVTFSANSATEAGGAIYNDGTFSLSDNGNVTFSGNRASSPGLYGPPITGGAIKNDANFTLSGNESVSFSGNSVSCNEGSTQGGAICNWGTFTLCGNGDVSFSGNTTTSTSSSFIYISEGGAIYNEGTFSLSDNETVTFSGNRASSSSFIYDDWSYAPSGGAIHNCGSFTLSDNGAVTFSGNTVSAYGDSDSKGGAIYNYYDFTLSGNGDVLFEKNAEVSNGIYRLRSIYSEGLLNLSASEGKIILFKDSVYASSTVNLNQDGTGDIIFTGATTETDLLAVKGTAGTKAEIEASRTSELNGGGILYGGRLIVEDGALLRGSLQVGDISSAAPCTATVLLRNATWEGSTLDFLGSSTLSVEGENSVSASVQLQENSQLNVRVGEVNKNCAALTLDGSLNMSENAMFTLSYDEELSPGTYKLLTMASGNGASTGIDGDSLKLLNHSWETLDAYWLQNTFYVELGRREVGDILLNTASPTSIEDWGIVYVFDYTHLKLQGDWHPGAGTSGELQVLYRWEGSPGVMLELSGQGCIELDNGYLDCIGGEFTIGKDICLKNTSLDASEGSTVIFNGYVELSPSSWPVELSAWENSVLDLTNADLTTDSGALMIYLNGGRVVRPSYTVDAHHLLNYSWSPGGANCTWKGALTLGNGGRVCVSIGEGFMPLAVEGDILVKGNTLFLNMSGWEEWTEGLTLMTCTGRVIGDSSLLQVGVLSEDVYSPLDAVETKDLWVDVVNYGTGYALVTSLTKPEPRSQTLTWESPKGVWRKGCSIGTGTFQAGDTVLFPNAATVTISGAVEPGAVEVSCEGNVTFISDTKVGGSGIAGSASLTKTGAGTLTLNGANAYSGGTEMTGGSLVAGHVLAFGTGTISLAAGTLNLNAKAVTNAIQASGGSISGGSAYTGALTVSGDVTLNGTLKASSVTLKSGSLTGGTLSDMTVYAEKGSLGSSFAGQSSLVGQNYTLAAALNNTGTLTLSGTLDASALTKTPIAGSMVALDGSQGNTGFAVSGLYSVRLVTGGAVKNGGVSISYGSDTLTLQTDGTARHEGSTIDYGTYFIGNGVSLSTTQLHRTAAGAAVEMSGGTLTVNDTTTVKAAAGSVLLQGGVLNGQLTNTAVTSTSGTIHAAMSGTSTLSVNGNTTVDGALALSSLALARGVLTADIATGSVTAMTVSGGSLNGGLTLNGGTLNLGKNSLAVTGTLSLASSTALTLDLSAYRNDDVYTLISAGSVVGDVSNLRLNAASTGRIAYTLSTNGADLLLTVESHAQELRWIAPKGIWAEDSAVGSGTFCNGDTMVFSSPAAVTVSGAVAPGEVIVTGSGKVTFTSDKKVYGSGIEGDTALTKSGEGLLTMNAGNTYSGGTELNAGTIKATAADSFGTGKITVNGGTLDLGGKAVANDIILSGAATLKGDAKYTGHVTVEGNATLLAKASYKGLTTIGADSSLTLELKATMSGNIDVAGGTLRIRDAKGMTLAKNQTLTLDGGAVNGLVTVGAGSTLQWYEGAISSPVLKGGTLDLGGKCELTLTGSKAQVAFGDKAIDLPGKGIVRTADEFTVKGGTVTVSALNGYDKAIEVAGGTLKLATGKVTTDNEITVSGNAAVVNGGTHYGDITVDGLLAKGTTIKLLNSEQRVTLNGSGEMLGAISGAGIVDVRGDVDITGAKLTNASILLGGTLTHAKGLTLAKGQTLTLDGGSVNGILTIGAGAVLDLNGHTLTAAPVLKGGTYDDGGSHTLTLTGAKADISLGEQQVSLLSKSFIKSDAELTVNSGTVTVNDFGTSEQALTVTGGTLKLATGKQKSRNTIVVNGTAAVVNGATHYGDIEVNGELAKGTTIKLLTADQRVVLKGGETLLGTISGAGIIDVNADINATAAKLTAATINLNGCTFTNTKGIKLAKGQTLNLTGASLELGTKGVLATVAGSTLGVSGSNSMTGSLTLGGGELVFSADGSLTLDSTLTLSKPMTVTGSGSITYDTLKPIKGELSVLFGGADVAQTGNTLLITGNAPTLSLAAAPLATAAEAPAQLDATPAIPVANPVADAMVQADWGILDAERAFMGAVNSRHQHASLLDKGRGAAWVSAFGASVRHGNQGTHHGSDGTIEGAAFGLEHAVSESGSIGLAVGRSKNRIAATGVTRLRQETAHVALYGQKQLTHGFTADAAATYGDTETKLGAASWTQKSAALSARLTHAQQLTDATAFRTFGGLSYEATDKGSIGTVHTGSVQNLRAEVGAGATHTAGKAHLYAEAALTGDLIRHNPTPDFDGARTHGANPGRLGLRATVGGIYEFTDTWSGTASYGIEAESRSTAHTLNIGVSKSF